MINVQVHCSKCGSVLEINRDYDTHPALEYEVFSTRLADITVVVNPCTTCNDASTKIRKAVNAVLKSLEDVK